MVHKYFRNVTTTLTTACLVLSSLGDAWAAKAPNPAESYDTTTPVKHLVVIFQENVSFDHYFATYPYANNPASEPAFEAGPKTPRANNLLSSGLLTENPNSVQPFRLDRIQAVTCDQNHNYGPEQKAFNSGAMDKFPDFVGQGNSTQFPCLDYGHMNGIVMGYYDGNTVTALWNYAQHYAMSDNSFGTQFGPSTPGAVSLISGNTAGAVISSGSAAGNIAGGASTGAIIGDPRPVGDDCNPTGKTYVSFPAGTTNVGDLLNTANFTWGWFQGGFRATSVSGGGVAICAAASVGLAGSTADYIPHHEPFQYYPETANPHHLPPSSISAIGTSDQAKHQYDLQDFFTVLADGRLPAVSFLKAKAVFDGHAGYSDPLDEQEFLVDTINKIQASPFWNDTAIIIAYDDSDGWYDHVMDPIINQSQVTDDFLTGPGLCGGNTASTTQGRCGYGPRLPLLVISPFARQNYVDHQITDQSSILRFVEDNWSLGRIGNGSTDEKAGTLDGLFDFSGGRRAARLFLDPETGLVAPHGRR